MIKAYSYVRFSSPEQAKGRSQARQLESCEAYCKKHGLALATDADGTFLDRGLSAYKSEHVGDKGQLKRFIDKVEDGSIEAGSYLIIESLDRLGREEVNEAYDRLRDLLKRGIKVVTLADERVYTKDAGLIEMIVSILVMSRANEESRTKSARVGDAMRKKQDNARLNKTPMGKQAPKWLQVSADGFSVNAERAAVVERIFEMAINGYGKTATAKALNAESIPAFKSSLAKPVAWGTSSIDKVLKNRATLGEYQMYSVQGSADGKRMPRGEPVPDYFPRIIDETTFYAAQAAVNQRRLFKSTKQSKNFNLWSGLAFCRECKSPLHLVNKGTPPKGGIYLHCSLARKGLCEAKMIRAAGAESVFREILPKVESLSLVQDSSAKILRELAEVSGRLAREQQKLLEFTILLDQVPSRSLAEKVQAYEATITEIQLRESNLRGALAAETITSKADFFSKIDLVSYEGRARANGLLKRLRVRVEILAATDEVLYVATQGDKMPPRHLFGIVYRPAEMTMYPLQSMFVEKLRIQDGGPAEVSPDGQPTTLVKA
ncbi:MAG: recombinase family protein [Pseudomonadota bacterium]